VLSRALEEGLKGVIQWRVEIKNLPKSLFIIYEQSLNPSIKKRKYLGSPLFSNPSKISHFSIAHTLSWDILKSITTLPVK
jgi:hypothetical protein